MLDYVRGLLTHAEPNKVTVEVNGLGYLLFIPLSHYAKLPVVGQEALFFLTPIIREDAHKLYGFLSRYDRDLFEQLNEVSGIGPKTALALIGHMDTADLQLAISQANSALISKIPGIGKKTAERLIVDMRDKCKKNGVPALQDANASPTSKGLVSDAISALVNLGYAPIQAQKAIKAALNHAEDEPDLAQLITLSLRQM